MGCASAEGQGGDEPQPAEGAQDRAAATARRVEVAAIRPSDARIELQLPGEVEGTRDALLAAALGGYVERVNIENGSEVRRGQVLVQVDAATHRARLAQTRVELDAAARELTRATRLGDALPRAQLDAAESRHAAALAAERTAALMVSRASIKAPFDGVVSGIAVEVGEVAPPGAPVLRLVNLDSVKVSISVSDRDVVALREGMEAAVTTEARAGVHTGSIVHIDPAANLRTRAFTVEVSVDNPDRSLMPGMIANVRIAEAVASGQVVVPQDWIVTRRDGNGVFLSDHGIAQWRPVQLGSVVGDQVVIAAGVAEGDRVVVAGHRELVDGDPLLIAREGTCCTDGRVTFERD
jgi:membrane fusion protein (multidrug efflux system)